METVNKFVPFALAVAVAAIAVFGRTGHHTGASADPWFDQAVLRNPRPVVVKFGADWCGPCRSMDQTLDRLEPRFSHRARFLRINVDEKPELFSAFGSGSGIPQVLIFRDGDVIASQKGFGGNEQLNTWLTENLRGL